jgi:hypothetical protein
MLDALNAAERLLLLQFLCSFAWVDGEVSDAERRFVRRLVERSNLAPDDVKEVESWLLMQPAAPDITSVPARHRRAFVESVRALIFMDGKVDPAEQEAFDRLRAILP